MFFVYYWVHNVLTNEKKIFHFENFVGDIGEFIIVNGVKYMIDDLAAEYVSFEEPEDF